MMSKVVLFAYRIMLSVCRYQPKPSPSVDNDKLRLDNSSYHAQPHLIIVRYLEKEGSYKNSTKEVTLAMQSKKFVA